MRISVNGEARETDAPTLAALIDALGFSEQIVGTAVNQQFVRVGDRAETPLAEGDAVEIVSPRQGG